LTPGHCSGGIFDGVSCSSQQDCPGGSCSGIGSTCTGAYDRGCAVVGNFSGQCQADCPSCRISSSCQYVVTSTPPPPGVTPPPGGGGGCSGICFDGSQGQNCGSYGPQFSGGSGNCSSGQICCNSGGINPGEPGGWRPFGGIAPIDQAAYNSESLIPGHCGYYQSGSNTAGYICNAYCNGISGVACDVDGNWGTDYGGVKVTAGLFEGGTLLGQATANQGSFPAGCGSPKSNPVSGFSSGFSFQIPSRIKDGNAHTLYVDAFDPDGQNGLTGWGWGASYNNNALGGQGAPNPFVLTCAGAAWWQVVGGDVATNGDLYSYVPQPPANANPNPYFILNGTNFGGFPGVAIYGGKHDFISGAATDPASTKKWAAQSTYLGKTYDSIYFNNLIPPSVSYTTINGNINNGTIASNTNPSHGFVWFKANGDTTINNDINVGNNKVILLVNGGDLIVKGRVNLNKGKGFFMAIVGKAPNGTKGNIIVDPSVDSQGNGGAPALEGIFFADNQIKTGISNKQLSVRGTLSALGGVLFQRDLGNINNKTTPGELVEFAPDILFSFPRDLVKGPVSWREVAP